MLAAFGIEETLGQLGEVELRGSARYDLMVRRDVDFNIYTGDPRVEEAAKLAERLANVPQMYGVQVNNLLLIQPPPGMPRGIYVGIRPLFQGMVWTIDAWYLRRSDALDQDEFGRDWWKALRPAQMDAILLLKALLNEQGRYGKEVLSAEVYRAVRDGVMTLAQFEVWHQTYVPH